MEELSGKTAVITGGADGIGRNLAQTLGKAGMNIVLADIETEKLAATEHELAQAQIPVLAIEMDVAVQADWQRAADAVVNRFGKVHMLINSAGVAGGIGAIETLDDPGWRWTFDVNVMGLVYGAHTLVPLMKEHGEQSWLINVASMAGLGGVPYGGAYTATKAAVVALSESWSQELSRDNIQVSVLAPAFVQTGIHLSHRNRQARYATDKEPTADVIQVAKTTAQAVENGIDVEIVGKRVLEALQAGEFYIFTHPSYQAVTDRRSAAISSAFNQAAQSPHLAEVKEQEITNFGSA